MILAWGLAVALAAPRPAPAPPAAPPSWSTTLDRITPAVVAIRVSSPRAFDGSAASTSVATGFVVDAELGLILTNRHVIETGPIVAEAVFADHEEVPLVPVWRDPVHDFGFFRFDPKALRHMTPVALPLAPEQARVGLDIRVVGNDAGEKLSILDGTLARLDRDAPSYGNNSYNDFNTFYLQAASSTSGGSSGSPVIDVAGRALALNAGGSRTAATSFYLPLDRPKRALELLRAGLPVPRGTIQAVFRHRPYDEVRRLGVRGETEAAARLAFPDAVGMLTVAEILPGGPADGKLEPGDVITRIEGQPIASFVPWEAWLDDHVGGTLTLDVERGGKPLSVTMPVQDLASITPSSWLEYSGGVLHALSYQQARNHGVTVNAGVYVATPGYALGNAGIGSNAVILAIGGRPARTLDELAALLADAPDRAELRVDWFDLDEPQQLRVSLLIADRRWYPMQGCRRDDARGSWSCVPAAPPSPRAAPTRAAPLPLDTPKGPLRAVAPALVWITTTLPYRIEGVPSSRYGGSGLVVDAARGIVLADRNTVPIDLGDVSVTVAGSVTVPAQILWVDPLLDVAYLQVDPAWLPTLALGEVAWSKHTLEAGDPAWLVGLDGRREPVQRQTSVQRLSPIGIPPLRQPHFRQSDLEVATVGDSLATAGGVLTDKHGRGLALWASFWTGDEKSQTNAGIPYARLKPGLDAIRAGSPPASRTLGVELWPMPLAEARQRGLPDDRAARIEAAGQRDVLTVLRRQADAPSASLLREGDLVLAVDGVTATDIDAVALAALAAPQLAVTILRDGDVRTIDVPTADVTARAVRRVVMWAGALVHAVPLAASAQRGTPNDGVYVTWVAGGSPGARYGLRPTLRIVAIDGAPIHDLAAFEAAITGRADRSTVRLRTVDLDGRVASTTLVLDDKFWPTAALARTTSWERQDTSQP